MFCMHFLKCEILNNFVQYISNIDREHFTTSCFTIDLMSKSHLEYIILYAWMKQRIGILI